MGLRAILSLVEKRVSDVVGRAGDKLPNFGFGEAARFKQEAPPRITWVPRSGRGAEGNERNEATRALWRRKLALEVRVWGEDFDKAEALAGHMLAAFTYVHGGRYGFVSEEWDTSSEMQNGIRGVLMLEVRLAFSDEPAKVVDGSSTPLGTDVSTEIG